MSRVFQQGGTVLQQDIHINKQSVHVYDCLIFLFSLAESPKLVRILKGKGEGSHKKIHKELRTAATAQ